MSEDHPPARSASSPDSEDIDVTAEEPAQSPQAARRARRAKAKLALRIPDDEVSRPQKIAKNGEPPAAVVVAEEPVAIKPSRIISVGPPPAETPPVAPSEAKTLQKLPSSPPTAPLDDVPIDDDDEAKTPMLPAVAKSAESDSDDIDVPVDEDEPEYRPRMPTLPSNPPPPPAETKSAAPPPSDDALEIDDVEAAAVLSSRPPPPRSFMPPISVPPAPRAPTISSKPPAAPSTPPLTPIPVDAMSSTPYLDEKAKADAAAAAALAVTSKPTRAMATALVDEDEARGIEEIEPDRQSAPPSIDSGDEIAPTDVVSVSPPKADARPVSTPPKPAPPLPKPGAMIPIVAPALATLSPLAPPPLTDTLVPRRRARPWWEDLFNDDFVRTMPKFSDAQIADEVDFIEDSLGVARGGSLLDLGCGTGRHAVELTRRGYSVVGFDLSLPLLARAGEEAQEANQKINFVQGDMREMTFDEAFDGIYCWGSTYGFFEEEKNIHVLTKVHKALKHGGQFLLDVTCRDFVIKQAPSLAWFEGEGCVCMDEMQVDWITSRMRVKRTMMLDDGRSKEIEYSIRVYSLHELGKMLHDCGFRVAEVSGRIQTPGIFFGPDSPRTLILAEKR